MKGRLNQPNSPGIAVVFSVSLFTAIHCLAQEPFSLTPSTTAEDSPTSGQGVPNQAPKAGGEGDLQKAVQNPVASLISVPIQNNTNFGIGPFGRIQNVLNIQPVIPLQATENWNLIIRWIAPIIWQPAPGTANLEVYGIEENTPAYFAAQDVQKTVGVYGLGDMQPTFFLSPVKAHGSIKRNQARQLT